MRKNKYLPDEPVCSSIDRGEVRVPSLPLGETDLRIFTIATTAATFSIVTRCDEELMSAAGRTAAEEQPAKLAEIKKTLGAYSPNMIFCQKPSVFQSPPYNPTALTKFYVLKGCSPLEISKFRFAENAIFQGASQTNANESKNPGVPTDPSVFNEDPTQGPALQLTDPVAARARFEKISECDSLKEWKKIDAFSTIFQESVGYLSPKPGKEKEAVEFLEAYLDKLEINAERVKTQVVEEFPETKPLGVSDGVEVLLGVDLSQIQVLNFAFALGEYDKNWSDKTDELYCRTPEGLAYLKKAAQLLLTAQYNLVAQIAIEEARANPDKPIPVIFTLIGGGVFGNDLEAIKFALESACAQITQSNLSNLDVCISAYGQNDLKLAQSISYFQNAPILTQRDLYSGYQNKMNENFQNIHGDSFGPATLSEAAVPAPAVFKPADLDDLSSHATPSKTPAPAVFKPADLDDLSSHVTPSKTPAPAPAPALAFSKPAIDFGALKSKLNDYISKKKDHQDVKYLGAQALLNEITDFKSGKKSVIALIECVTEKLKTPDPALFASFFKESKLKMLFIEAITLLNKAAYKISRSDMRSYVDAIEKKENGDYKIHGRNYENAYRVLTLKTDGSCEGYSGKSLGPVERAFNDFKNEIFQHFNIALPAAHRSGEAKMPIPKMN